MMRKLLLFSVLLFLYTTVNAQVTVLSFGWKAIKASEITVDGCALTDTLPDLSGWLDAYVPGTVLTTLLNNNRIPDPYYGMNNESIPDISEVGRDYYTYWFFNRFNTGGVDPEKQVSVTPDRFTSHPSPPPSARPPDTPHTPP